MAQNKLFISAERLKALTDGVFAIALTILVLDIKVPDIAIASDTHNLWHALAQLIPNLIAYVISFLVIAKYWQIHNFVLRDIHEMDTILLWLTFLFLLTISFIPFPTQLLAKYNVETSLIIFNCCVSLPAVFIGLLSTHILRDEHLRSLKSLSGKTTRQYTRPFLLKIYSIPLVGLISVIFGVFSFSAGLIAWVLLAVVAVF